jgi:protein-S-isoprenylcysteine O-methyltransferase Ste14
MAEPARLSFAALAILQALTHAVLVYLSPRQPASEKQLDRAAWHALLFELSFILAAFGDRRNQLTWNAQPGLRWVGLGIYLLGAILSISANLTWLQHLRQNPQGNPGDPIFLTSGVYKIIRHPTQLSLILYCLGFSIAFRSWAGLSLLILLLPAILNHIHIQEKQFAQQYRLTWPARKRSSKRLLPFIY